MFINEYTMTRKRYDKWSVPKFWKSGPMFFIWCFIFIIGTLSWIYFNTITVPLRWKTVCAFLVFISVYRGVFFKWMHADKTFRVTRGQYFNGKDWTCKVIIGEKNITLYINNKLNNKVDWKDINRFEEAKSYYKLASGDQNEGVMLDKVILNSLKPGCRNIIRIFLTDQFIRHMTNRYFLQFYAIFYKSEKDLKHLYYDSGLFLPQF